MSELVVVRGPVVVHSHNVFDPRQSKVFRSPGNLSLNQLRPNSRLPTICALNGEYVLPDDWDWIPSPEDHVFFCTLPQGGGGNASQTVIGVILIVVGYLVPGLQPLMYVGAGLLVSGLIPTPNVAVPLVDNQTQAASPTYSVQISGNSARIGQAIPVLYGRHILMPDFASQPYSEFASNGDQYYHALLCLGQLDKFTLESVMIDDTNLTHFSDVETQLVGPQYTTPLSLVNAAVVNAPEVANNDLKYGVYVGPFAACGSGLQANAIGIDMICPKGLYFAADDGTLNPKTVKWLVEARKISDSGAVAGSWTLLGNEELTDHTNTPIRKSYKYTVPPGRYEVRVSRQDVEDTNSRAAHAIQWAAMRSYLTIGAPLEPSATFLAIRMRATSQLSGLSQRRISVIIRRWLPTWNPDTGWSEPVETASIAWAVADVLRNSDYGGNVPDSRIDLQSLYDLDQLWASRGDEFNGVFDKRITVWNAIATILRAGRARPIMRSGVFTFVRDTQQELPVAMFSMRNIKRGSFAVDYVMVNDDTADGVELQFFNRNTWSSDYVRLPMPGVEESVIPSSVAIAGITDENQALRECAYIVADASYRRSAISFVTELEGYQPAYGDLIAVAHDVAGWGCSGEIESYSGSTAVCTEELQWSIGDNYAVIVDQYGDVKGPYKVVPGTAQRSMQFVELPDSGDIYTGTERERTRFSMGAASSYVKMCRIVGITPQEGNAVQIKAVVEDNRVHTADAPYAGSGGGGHVSGKIGHYAPDDIPNYDLTSDAQRVRYGFYADEDLKVGSANDAGYVYDN